VTDQPEPDNEEEDAKDRIVGIAAEDLQARTDALKGTMPDKVRRHVVAQQSVEILTGLIRRHLHR
jgi:hypothetical protein